MEFYISDIEDYIRNNEMSNEIMRMSYLLEKSYANECMYFGLFIFSTIIGIFICTLKDNKKEYVYIQQSENNDKK
jgi:hypothetical protein